MKKTTKKTPFQVCFSIVTDENIRTDKSGQGIHDMLNYREYFEEVFVLDDPGYDKWWSSLASRSDVSDDDRWEIESLQDDLHMLLNVRDNLRKSGVIK